MNLLHHLGIFLLGFTACLIIWHLCELYVTTYKHVWWRTSLALGMLLGMSLASAITIIR